MVLRCREGGAGRVKAGVAVAVKKAEGYGRPEVLLEEARTAADGIALVSGLQPPMAAVTVQHPEAVTRTVHGLTATPGTFTFREIEIEKGGSLRARISLGGAPVAGAACRLLSFEENPNGPSEPRMLYEGRSDKEGFCRTGPIPPGPYTLRLTPPESRSFTDRLAIVEAGKETEVEVALMGIHLTGRITRDDKPAAGFQVIVMDLERPERYHSPGPVAEAVANEEGEYEVTLCVAGEYLIRPASPQGTPAAARKTVTLERAEEVVDFDLKPQGFAGRVMDEDEKPVAEASAVLRWKGGMLLAKTDPDGRFEIAVQDEGEGTLYAIKPGYRDSDKVEVAVPSPVSGVVLVLSRSGAVRGTVLSAAGAPVPGALVAVTARVASPDAFPQVRSARADASGRFEMDRVPGAPLRVFVSGPGCPLTSSTLTDGSEEVTLRCAELPAALEITFKDDQGRPIPRAAVLLRQRGEVVPSSVLASHLAALGVSAEADGSGRLTLAGLAPGDYDLFLASESSEGTLQAGLPNGFLTSATLYPLTTSELEITPGERGEDAGAHRPPFPAFAPPASLLPISAMISRTAALTSSTSSARSRGPGPLAPGFFPGLRSSSMERIFLAASLSGFGDGRSG